MPNALEHIIEECKKGNAAAQRRLYEKYRIKWYMLSLRYGKNQYEADDILQEGLINIYKDLHQFAPTRGSFTTYSCRVLVNAALKYLKKNQWQNSFGDIDNTYNKNPM